MSTIHHKNIKVLIIPYFFYKLIYKLNWTYKNKFTSKTLRHKFSGRFLNQIIPYPEIRKIFIQFIYFIYSKYFDLTYTLH